MTKRQSAKKSDENKDPTGREQLTWNVAVSWASELVAVVIGFIMPRLIDENLGQISLGIWDSSWALINYLRIINLGTGANSSRFVAPYQMAGRYEDLCKIVSSAHCIQLAITATIIVATGLVCLGIEALGETRLEGHTREIQWVVLFLGLSLASQMVFDTYRGVMTGYHLWGTHNLVNTIQSLTSAVGMACAVMLGYDLYALAVVYFSVVLAGEFLRYRVSRHYCPEAVVSRRYVNMPDIRRIAAFGAKNFGIHVGPLVLHQSVYVIITATLGPAMLAVFARPASLISHIDTFILKFASVVMPTTSAIQGRGSIDELRGFVLEMSKTGWALSLPPAVFLLVYGTNVIELWMGESYVAEELMWVLAIGSGLMGATRATYRMLFAMNQHGRASVGSLVIFGAVALIGLPIMVYQDVGLATAAFVFVIGDVVFGLLVPTHQLARQLDIGAIRFLYLVSNRALIIAFVTWCVLLLVHQIPIDDPYLRLALGALVHGAVVLVLYWMFVFTDEFKAKLAALLPIPAH